MNPSPEGCVILADRHHGVTEGVRGLLSSTFDTVVMVADERSLLRAARRLHPSLVVADLSLVPGNGLDWLYAFRNLSPGLKLIVLSVHDEPSICGKVLEIGADGFVLKRQLATELLRAVDAVRSGLRYVPPGFAPAPHKTPDLGQSGAKSQPV